MEVKMKACIAIFVLAFFGGSALAQAPPQSTHPTTTRTEIRITAANEAIQKDPGRYQGYNDLAYNLVKLAEETSDPADLEKAETALGKSFALAPKNFQGEKTNVFLLLAEHEYSKALAEATALNHDTPDDVLLWGYLADAHSALGDYDDAVKSAQWMINLRPGNVPGLLRGADLRTVWGDTDGALEFLRQALQATPDFETGDVASILTKMANVQFGAGEIEAAEKLDQQALHTFPDYYAALESLARVRTAQGRYPDAVELLEKRNVRFSRTDSLYALAMALQQAGKTDESKQAYIDFERMARDEVNRADNANHDLVFYYTDHAASPAEALRIAALEAGRRHDLRTLDAYAWALYVNHDYAKARGQIEQILAENACDATIFYHAGAIAEKLNDRAAAVRYLKESLKINPSSENAEPARGALERLAPGSAPSLRRR
jgi:tetratricopeptide (TPR) repeat protein